MTFIAIMSAVLCIVAPFAIPLPFTGVPVTFANMILYLNALLLGMKAGTVSCLIYLLLGFVGLPVFSGFTGGFSKLAGPTGGYLIGFLFLALITGFFAERFNGRRGMLLVGMILGTAAEYLFGTIWLALQTHLSFTAALFAGVIPFIPCDGLKMAAILIIGPPIKRGLQFIK